MQGAFERSNAQLAREAEQALAQRRQMLDLHEGVVQGLAVAKLELDLNQTRGLPRGAERRVRESPHAS